jgi:hypothetical protein
LLPFSFESFVCRSLSVRCDAREWAAMVYNSYYSGNMWYFTVIVGYTCYSFVYQCLSLFNVRSAWCGTVLQNRILPFPRSVLGIFLFWSDIYNNIRCKK